MTWIYGNIKSYHFTHSPKEFIMPTTKEVDYHKFFDFAIQEAEKNPSVTVNEALELFQKHDQNPTKAEKAAANWTLEQVNEYITNSIRREKFNTGY